MISPGAAACSRRLPTATASPLTNPRHDLAAVHTDARLEVSVGLAIELRDTVANRDGSAYRAQRIVLVHNRDSEDGHHLVSDELLDCAPVLLDHRRGPLAEPRHDKPQRLRVQLLGKLRVGHEVAEEDGDQFAPLGRPTEEPVHVSNVTPRDRRRKPAVCFSRGAVYDERHTLRVSSVTKTGEVPADAVVWVWIRPR